MYVKIRAEEWRQRRIKARMNTRSTGENLPALMERKVK